MAAILIGANVALLCWVGLIAWQSQLHERRIVRTEAWRALRPKERRAGEGGRRWALHGLEELALRFAKTSSALAIALAGTAFVMPGDLYSDIRRRSRLEQRALFDAERYLIRIKGRAGDNG